MSIKPHQIIPIKSRAQTAATICFAYLVFVATLAGFLGRHWWPFELLCFLRLQFACLLILISLFVLFTGLQKQAIGFAIGGILVLGLCLTETWGGRPPGKKHDFRIVALNVLRSNQDHQEVIAIIEELKPDVAILTEVDQNWINGISKIEAILPYTRCRPDDYDFGIAIYSRHALNDCNFVELAQSRTYSVNASMSIAGKSLRIIGAHPFPALTSSSVSLRNRQLQQLAGLAKQNPGPTILCGDLNTIGWSPFFQDLLRQGNLKDTRKGFGINLSHTIIQGVRTTIDHILVSPDIFTHKRGVIPCRGSDHDAVFADISFD